MNQYWIIIRVQLDHPVGAGSDGKRIVGYYQDFGVTASEEKAAHDLVAANVEEGSIDWSKSTCEIVDVERLNARVRARSTNRSEPGVWYRSGRGFFPEGESTGQTDDPPVNQ